MEKITENTVSPTAGEDKVTKTDEAQGTEELLKIRNLPKERNWDGRYLSFYQGFWCPSIAIPSTIAFRNHFQAHHTDLILASFPKSGTTWLKALTFAIANRTKHPLTESPLLYTNPQDCVPSLEFKIYKNPSTDIKAIPTPRILATHIPYAALPSTIKDSQCKIVYICRNPMDQFISYWHFGAKLWSQTNYSISLEEAFDKFCSGVSFFGPFWDHVLGYWKASRERPDKVLFLKYEELKDDIVCHTKSLAEFLGFQFSEEEQRQGVVEQVTKLCSFENLKDLEVNRTGKHASGHQNSDFFRKAEVGDWSNYLSPPMVENIKKLIQEKFEGSGLTF